MSYHDYYIPQWDTDEHRKKVKEREEAAKKAQKKDEKTSENKDLQD